MSWRSAAHACQPQTARCAGRQFWAVWQKKTCYVHAPCDGVMKVGQCVAARGRPCETTRAYSQWCRERCEVCVCASAFLSRALLFRPFSILPETARKQTYRHTHTQGFIQRVAVGGADDVTSRKLPRDWMGLKLTASSCGLQEQSTEPQSSPAIAQRAVDGQCCPWMRRRVGHTVK